MLTTVSAHAQFVPFSVMNKDRGPNLNAGRTDADCVAAGGTMITIPGSLRICKFALAACPSPWVDAASPNWTTTSSNSCAATCGSCTSGGHTFNVQAVESCSYNAYQVIGCMISWPTNCDATVTHVGCK